MSSGVTYRQATPADAALIMDSWLKSWRKSAWAGTIPNNRYFEIQRECIEQLISRGARLEVAASESHPGIIIGWVCSELTQDTPARTVIHYCYVKDPYLKVSPSVGETLCRRAAGLQPGYYTHRYRTVLESLPGGHQDWRHAPEIARRAPRRRHVSNQGTNVHPGGEDS